MFLITDVGCYADGGFGHDHVRQVLARLLKRMHRHHPRGGEGLHWSEVKPIVEALEAPMSDDAWEEDEAIEWLDRDCEEGCHFTFSDGDLLLVADDEEADDAYA